MRVSGRGEVKKNTTIRPITTLDSPFGPLGGSEKDEEKGVSGK